ncbi:MAG: hypothetical protein QF755_01230 [Candidatus Peribacteraceae bacterium]|nr:hypothetical protein [Candidatus Peribacteraceae bacterium]HCI04106.1 hypothetical protein [Candidatus Peribacteria bacterium]
MSSESSESSIKPLTDEERLNFTDDRIQRIQWLRSVNAVRVTDINGKVVVVPEDSAEGAKWKTQAEPDIDLATVTG